MAMAKNDSRLHSLFCSIVASGMFLLAGSVVWLSTEGVASPSESSPVSFATRDCQGAVELPGGMDPTEVVRRVEKNRQEVTRDTSGLGSLQTAEELGPPFHIGGEPVYGPAAYSQGRPAAAFDGTNYLVVWTDNRSGSSEDIYGARVNVGGVVLDPLGIAISTAETYQGCPAVAFNGTNFLVAWYDYRSGSSYDIYGARVSVGGAVLDPTGIAISTAAGFQEYPAVGSDGTNYLVVWHDGRDVGDLHIYGARVSAGGAVLDPAGIAISTAAVEQYRPRIAFDGTNCLVVWYDYRSGSPMDIYGARVSAGGVVLDPAGIAISTAANEQVSPAIAFDGTNYLVVWEDRRSGTSDIYGARVSVGGSVLDPSGIAICGEAIGVGGQTVPVAYRAYQSYPNPFNPLCTIRYDIAHAGSVSLQVFGVDGSSVRTLVEAWREPGVYSETWSGRDDSGGLLPSGVYFYRLKAGDFVATRKMVLIR